MSTATHDNALELCPKSFARFCQFITSELGIKMSDAKLPMLQSRLQRRLRELQLGSLEDYQQYLFSLPDEDEERVQFINAITTNKTDFFREPKHFEYLVSTALPNLDPSPPKASLLNTRGLRPTGDLRAPRTELDPARSVQNLCSVGSPPSNMEALPQTSSWPFKLWCAGCSSGEEPYTLSMVLSEFAARRPGFDFEILATDISTKVLNHAQLGIYEAERVEPVAPNLRSKYLLRSKDSARPKVRIVPQLRRKISFYRLNFMDAEYPVRDRFEVIFFRNVMIYFSKATQEAVIEKLCRHLIPGGYLFVGHSESLAGLQIPVTCVGSAVYRKPK